jgi:hypothetical protein
LPKLLTSKIFKFAYIFLAVATITTVSYAVGAALLTKDMPGSVTINTAGNITVSPTELAFGEVGSGQSSTPISVVITNTSPYTLDIYHSDGGPSYGTITWDSAYYNPSTRKLGGLAASESLTATVTFTASSDPADLGLHEDILVTISGCEEGQTP